MKAFAVILMAFLLSGCGGCLSPVKIEKKEKAAKELGQMAGSAIEAGKKVGKKAYEVTKEGAKKGAGVSADYAKEKEILPTGEEWLDKRLGGFVEKHASPEEEQEGIETPEPEREPRMGEKFFWDPEEERYVALAQDGTVGTVGNVRKAPPPEPEPEPEPERETKSTLTRAYHWWAYTLWGALATAIVGIGILTLILVIIAQWLNRRQQNL